MNPTKTQNVKLGSLGVFLKGQGIKRTDVQSTGVPCLRYGEIYTRFNDYTDGLVSHVSAEVAATAIRLRKGDVVFAGSGETKAEIGKCTAWLGDTEAVVGGDTVILRGHGQDAIFLASLLNTAPVAKQKAARGQGDAVVHISARALGDIDIALPPLAVQKNVSKTIRDTNSLIASLECLITKKQAVKQGMMQELLTGKTRLPGYNSKWVRKTLKEIVVTPITDGPHMTPEFLTIGVPFLSVNNLVDGRIDFDDVRYISRLDHIEFARKCAPRQNDILLGKAASVGKVALVETDREFNIWSPIAMIRVGTENLARFVYYQLQGSSSEDQITLLTNTSSQGNIGMGDIEKLMIDLPPIQEQFAIASALGDIDRDIDSTKALLAKAKSIQIGMMQELLTGRTRLQLAGAMT